MVNIKSVQLKYLAIFLEEISRNLSNLGFFSIFQCTFSVLFSYDFSWWYKIGLKDLSESVFKSNFSFSEEKIHCFLLSRLARYSLYYIHTTSINMLQSHPPITYYKHTTVTSPYNRPNHNWNLLLTVMKCWTLQPIF